MPVTEGRRPPGIAVHKGTMPLGLLSLAVKCGRVRLWCAFVFIVPFLFPLRLPAADWLILGGTEAPQAQEFRVTGFIQPLYWKSFGKPLKGLQSRPELNGHQASFNTVGTDDTTSTFILRRARLGVRGYSPGTSKRVNYALQLEGGSNATTRSSPVVLLDASLTWNAAPGLRLRIGQFKLPTMDEILEGIQTVGDFISYSQVASELLQESRVGWNESSQTNFFVGGSSAFRDIGVQAFDSFASGSLHYGYAIMLSNGRFGGADDDNAKDITARIQIAHVFEGDAWDAHREEAMLFAWNMQGSRLYRSKRYLRTRQGIGAQFNRKMFRFRGEYAEGRGMLPLNQVPPISGGVGLAPEGKGRGWYIQGSWALLPDWEANLRYDLYAQEYDSPQEKRTFRTWTFGGQYKLSAGTRIMLNYEMRALSAPKTREDETTLAAAMADRIGLQFTAVF